MTVKKDKRTATAGADPLLAHIDDNQVTDPPTQRPERGPATTDAPAPERVGVAVDTWISRPDLGPQHRTFVAAGDFVPPDLVNHPRTPV